MGGRRSKSHDDTWHEVYVASDAERSDWVLTGLGHLFVGILCIVVLAYCAFVPTSRATRQVPGDSTCGLAGFTLFATLFAVLGFQGLGRLLDALLACSVVEGAITQRREQTGHKQQVLRSIEVQGMKLFLTLEGYERVQNAPRARVEYGLFARFVRRVWLPGDAPPR